MVFTKGKDISSISGLLPMLDRMVNIFGRDVNLNASGKKPSSTRWQRGGNSPYGQVFHSILISIWYLPLAETIQGPALWSSLPVSLFLLLTDFLPIQNKSCQNIFLTHTRILKSQRLSSLGTWWWRMDSSLAHGFSSQACDNTGDSNFLSGVRIFFLILKKNLLSYCV